jgi:hypothetical protein
MTEEQKENLSEKMTGKPSPKKGKPGKPQTAEANAARAASMKGHKQTPEQIAKKAAGRRAFYQRKREAEASRK